MPPLLCPNLKVFGHEVWHFALAGEGTCFYTKHKKSFILHKNQMGIFFHRWELHSSRNNFLLHLDGVVSTVLNWLLGSSAELVAGQFGRVGLGHRCRMRKREKTNYCIHQIGWLSDSRPSGGCRPLTSDLREMIIRLIFFLTSQAVPPILFMNIKKWKNYCRPDIRLRSQTGRDLSWPYNCWLASSLTF